MRVPWCQPFSQHMGKRNSNFQFRFSFTHDVGNGNSNFYFCFLFSQYIENEIGTSIFVFRFSITSYNRIAIAISVFHLLLSYGIEKRNLNFDFRLSFSFSIIMISQDSRLLSRRDPSALSVCIYFFSTPLTILKMDAIANCMKRTADTESVVTTTNSTKKLQLYFYRNLITNFQPPINLSKPAVYQDYHDIDISKEMKLCVYCITNHGMKWLFR